MNTCVILRVGRWMCGWPGEGKTNQWVILSTCKMDSMFGQKELNM